MTIWSCKIGEVKESKVPQGGDFPMRQAVEKAYKELIGEDCLFDFSGWGAELTESERHVVDYRSDGAPRFCKTCKGKQLYKLADPTGDTVVNEKVNCPTCGGTGKEKG